MVETV